MPVKSALVIRHDANVTEVNRLSTLLKIARAAVSESGKALVRGEALKERQAVRAVAGKCKVGGVKVMKKRLKDVANERTSE